MCLDQIQGFYFTWSLTFLFKKIKIKGRQSIGKRQFLLNKKPLGKHQFCEGFDILKQT